MLLFVVLLLRVIIAVVTSVTVNVIDFGKRTNVAIEWKVGRRTLEFIRIRLLLFGITTVVINSKVINRLTQINWLPLSATAGATQQLLTPYGNRTR